MTLQRAGKGDFAVVGGHPDRLRDLFGLGSSRVMSG
jgi:hypothetical protein